MTKIKNKGNTFFKDKIAGIIFTDAYFIEYIETIVSNLLELKYEDVHGHLILITPRVNANFNTKGSIVDAAYESTNNIINIEINFNNDHFIQDKNYRYVCNLILKQEVGKNKKQKYLKNVTQININRFDYFHKNEFVYTSVLMEQKHHLIRSNLVTIYDINMDFLNNFKYNDIKEVSDSSLEKLLYPLVCDNINDLKKLYKGNKIMEKVTNKISVMQENWYEDLYYDPEELRRLGLEEAKEEAKAEGLAEGLAEGIKQTKIETAKNLIQMGLSNEDTSKATNLPVEEVIKLRESNKDN